MGNECNGCGLCCLVKPCKIAEEHLGVSVGPCPALEWEGGRSFCGMVRRPTYHLARALGLPWPGHTVSRADEVLGGRIAVALGVGMGCDAWDETVDGDER